MEFYQSRNPEDFEWVARAALFHGHLGPWLIAGAMIGQDAIRRLDTPGQWKIQVVCWMPADRHRTPFTCLLDGLQSGCGATMGKRNLWLRDIAEISLDGWPRVHVIRPADGSRSTEGFAYAGTEELHHRIGQVNPERLEADSRQLARGDVARLFQIAPLSEAELAWSGHSPKAPGRERPQ